MINTNEIEAGDKLHLRDGSVFVVKQGFEGNLQILHLQIDVSWLENGRWLENREDDFDIIRIEKTPKPVVETHKFLSENFGVYKITITDGEATIERVK